MDQGMVSEQEDPSEFPQSNKISQMLVSNVEGLVKIHGCEARTNLDVVEGAPVLDRRS